MREAAQAKAFRQSTFELLRQYGIGDETARRVVDDGPNSFTKATDRHVIGSILDFVRLLLSRTRVRATLPGAARSAPLLSRSLSDRRSSLGRRVSLLRRRLVAAFE